MTFHFLSQSKLDSVFRMGCFSPSSMIFDNRLSKLSIGGDGSIILCSFNVQTCSSRKPDNLRAVITFAFLLFVLETGE
ncbi:hypothetical protein Csa_003373 [Cucumis sativus]|uniref:Uncharacterized protein n=1 Tax=Cucumis sativus TaxID=3659 RepID=A0A0A0KN26_CUCSA|nr:hypothetical protein Csa_003373 [Cucumis sativus]